MIIEAKDDIILSDFAIQTDRKLKSNRPNMFLKVYEKKTTTHILIDISGLKVNNITDLGWFLCFAFLI